MRYLATAWQAVVAKAAIVEAGSCLVGALEFLLRFRWAYRSHISAFLDKPDNQRLLIYNDGKDLVAVRVVSQHWAYCRW